MRPRGTPPTPRAASTPIDPLEIELIAANSFDPSLMIAPLPNWRSICVRAVSAAFNLSVGMLTMFLLRYASPRKEIAVGGVGSMDIRVVNRVYGPRRQGVKNLYSV